MLFLYIEFLFLAYFMLHTLEIIATNILGFVWLLIVISKMKYSALKLRLK